MHAGALDWGSLVGEDSSMIDFLLGEERSGHRGTSALNLAMPQHEPSIGSGPASGAGANVDDNQFDGMTVVAAIPSDLPSEGMKWHAASHKFGKSTGMSV